LPVARKQTHAVNFVSITDGRNPRYGGMPNIWCQVMNRYYQRWLLRVHPVWRQALCEIIAYQVLTLILGGWSILIGSSGSPSKKTQGNNVVRTRAFDRCAEC